MRSGEPLEARVAAEWSEIRIDPDPSWRQVAGMAHESIEHIDRALRLFRHRVDAREIVEVHDSHAPIT